MINSFPTAPLNLGRIRPMRLKNCSFLKTCAIVTNPILFGQVGIKSFLEGQKICIKVNFHRTQQFIWRGSQKLAYLGDIDTESRNLFSIFIFASKKQFHETKLMIPVNAYSISARWSYFYFLKPSAG